MTTRTKNGGYGGLRCQEEEGVVEEEEDEIGRLQANGELEEVCGSQSMLSQEIQDMSQHAGMSQASANMVASSFALLAGLKRWNSTGSRSGLHRRRSHGMSSSPTSTPPTPLLRQETTKAADEDDEVEPEREFTQTTQASEVDRLIDPNIDPNDEGFGLLTQETLPTLPGEKDEKEEVVVEEEEEEEVVIDQQHLADQASQNAQLLIYAANIMDQQPLLCKESIAGDDDDDDDEELVEDDDVQMNRDQNNVGSDGQGSLPAAANSVRVSSDDDDERVAVARPFHSSRGAGATETTVGSNNHHNPPNRKRTAADAVTEDTTTTTSVSLLEQKQPPTRPPLQQQKKRKRATSPSPPPPSARQPAAVSDSTTMSTESTTTSTENLESPSTTAATNTTTTKKTRRKTKGQREAERAETNNIAEHVAKRAAETIEKDPEIFKQLLLSMALTRENPRSHPSQLPGPGTQIKDGFYWGTFAPLETVLRAHMEQYYDLSTTKCQSKDQQAFNNQLVILIKQEASNNGWTFDPTDFDDKKIRDRIRCFFKTHIQNAKKRLNTMIRNPTKKANAKALAKNKDLIERYNRKTLRRSDLGDEQQQEKQEEGEEDDEDGDEEEDAEEAENEEQDEEGAHKAKNDKDEVCNGTEADLTSNEVLAMEQGEEEEDEQEEDGGNGEGAEKYDDDDDDDEAIVKDDDEAIVADEEEAIIKDDDGGDEEPANVHGSIVELEKNRALKVDEAEDVAESQVFSLGFAQLSQDTQLLGAS